MVQAFGREPDVNARFAEKAERGPRRRAARGRRRGPLPAGPRLPAVDGDRDGARRSAATSSSAATSRSASSCCSTRCCCSSCGRSRRSAGSSTSRSARSRRPAAASRGWTASCPLVEPETSAPLPDGPLGVRFSDVHFGYGDGDEVLRGLDLQLAPGEIVAVCGATGSGKTSLLQLLPRFYDLDSGAVEIGGVDVRAMRLHPLRETIGLVTQRPVLFSAPLRDNLLDGRPDATEDGDARGLRGGRRRRVRRRAAGRLRHADRRARRQPLRRPAPARRAGARAAVRTRACSCSTTRCRRSTPRPSARSSSACARPSPAAPC